MLLINSGVEQLAARKAHNLEGGGSSPPPAPNSKINRIITRFIFCVHDSYIKNYVHIFVCDFSKNRIDIVT